MATFSFLFPDEARGELFALAMANSIDTGIFTLSFRYDLPCNYIKKQAEVLVIVSGVSENQGHFDLPSLSDFETYSTGLCWSLDGWTGLGQKAKGLSAMNFSGFVQAELDLMDIMALPIDKLHSSILGWKIPVEGLAKRGLKFCPICTGYSKETYEHLLYFTVLSEEGEVALMQEIGRTISFVDEAFLELIGERPRPVDWVLGPSASADLWCRSGRSYYMSPRPKVLGDTRSTRQARFMEEGMPEMVVTDGVRI